MSLKYAIRVIFLSYILVLVACAEIRKTTRTPAYNDTVYRQLWSADWSPDGRHIATGGVDSVLRIYDGKKLSLLRSFPFPSTIQVVRWGKEAGVVAVATVSEYVYLLNINSGKIIQLDNSSGIPGRSNGSRAMSWNSAGDRLAVGGMDGLIRIWDKNGSLIKTIDKYPPGTDFVSYLALDWHPSGAAIVACNNDIVVYDTTGAQISKMEHPNKAAIILCARWHPSGDFFVVGDYGHNWEGENVPSLLHYWSKEGKLIRSVEGSKGEYRSIAWSPDGSRLATASDVLRIWNKEGKLQNQSPPDGSNYLWGISWDPSGKKIITSSRHRTIAIWDSTATLLNHITIKE